MGGDGVQQNWERERTTARHTVQYIPIIVLMRAAFPHRVRPRSVSFRSFCSAAGRRLAAVSHSFHQLSGCATTTGLFVIRHGPKWEDRNGLQRRPLDPVFVICQGRLGFRGRGFLMRGPSGFFRGRGCFLALVGPPKMSLPDPWIETRPHRPHHNVARRRTFYRNDLMFKSRCYLYSQHLVGPGPRSLAVSNNDRSRCFVRPVAGMIRHFILFLPRRCQ
jgi:hypothetical protein